LHVIPPDPDIASSKQEGVKRGSGNRLVERGEETARVRLVTNHTAGHAFVIKNRGPPDT